MGWAPRAIGLGALWLCGCHLVFPYGAADSAHRSDLPAGERRVGGEERESGPLVDLRLQDRSREASSRELGAPKTETLEVVADSYVEDTPSNPYPEQLWIGTSRGVERWTYLRYRALPLTAKISKAQLRLCVQGVGSSYAVMKVNITLVTGQWDESTIKWGNEPSVSPAPVLSDQPISPSNVLVRQADDQYVAKVDVTSLVTGGLAHGFQLKPATPGLDLTLYAREYFMKFGALPTGYSTACDQAGLHDSELEVTYTE